MSVESRATRCGRIMVFPEHGYSFPDRCVATNMTDDLVEVESDLESVGLSKRERGALAFLFRSTFLLARLVTRKFGRAPDLYEELATYNYKVTRSYWESWQRRLARKKAVTVFSVIGGPICFVVAIAYMIATASSLREEGLVDFLMMGVFVFGLFAPLFGALYGYFAVRPILHSRERFDPGRICVVGACSEYLAELPQETERKRPTT